MPGILTRNLPSGAKGFQSSAAGSTDESFEPKRELRPCNTADQELSQSRCLKRVDPRAGRRSDTGADAGEALPGDDGGDEGPVGEQTVQPEQSQEGSGVEIPDRPVGPVLAGDEPHTGRAGDEGEHPRLVEPLRRRGRR